MKDKSFIVIGCGSMGRRRIRHALKLTEGCKLGVFDLRQDRMDEVSAKFQVIQMNRLADFLPFKPDGIFICVPPAEHGFYIDWAIANGINFMVEQPITHSLENLDKIKQGVKDKGLIVHVSNNHKFSAEIAAINEIIRSRELGKVLSVIIERGEWLPDWHPYEPYTDYYPSRKAMGGGLDSICEMSWLHYLFGEVEESHSLAGKQSQLDIDTPDVVQILLRFKNGPMVSLHTDMLQHSYSGMFKFIMEEGTIVHTAPDKFLKVFSRKDKSWKEIPLRDGTQDYTSMQGKADFNFVEPMYERDAAAFINALKEKDHSLNSLEDGITCLKVIYPLVYGKN